MADLGASLDAGDRYAQFLIMVADVCAAAALARVQVRVQTADGRQLEGVPAAPASADTETEAAEIGYAPQLVIGGHTIVLSDVTDCAFSGRGLG